MKARILIVLSFICLAAFMPITAGAQFNMDEISVETPEAPSVPDIDIPSVDIPEIDMPTLPEVDTLTTDDLTGDTIEIPEIESPTVDIPVVEVDTPNIDIPEIDFPEVTPPNIDIPTTDTPIVIEMPDVDVPEPDVPEVTAVIPENIRQELEEIKTITATEAIKRLKKDELLNSEVNLSEAVKTVFTGRENEAVYQAMNVLRQERRDYIEGEIIDRSDEYNVAKSIFKNFPTEATAILVTEYNNGNGALKGNILQVLGGLKEQPAAEDILVQALDDTSPSNEITSDEIEGEPMRVCDLAYNQLVLRNEITGVLRTLGPIHRIEVRDYHIQILKNKLMPIVQ